MTYDEEIECEKREFKHNVYLIVWFILLPIPITIVSRYYGHFDDTGIFYTYVGVGLIWAFYTFFWFIMAGVFTRFRDATFVYLYGSIGAVFGLILQISGVLI